MLRLATTEFAAEQQRELASKYNIIVGLGSGLRGQTVELVARWGAGRRR